MKEKNRTVVFEGETPVLGSIGAIDENRLLLVGDGPEGDPTGYLSEDAGVTWGAPFRFMQSGKPLEGTPMKVGITRLDSGELGMVYFKEETFPHTANYKTRGFYYAASTDDGKTWTGGIPMDIPREFDLDKGVGHVLWGGFTQLSTGRLIEPAYWFFGGRNAEVTPVTPSPVTATIGGHVMKRVADGHTYEAAMAGCYVYYSDDMGETWNRCTGSITVWPLPNEDNQGGFGAATEPVIIELKDGRVMMFVRTTVGRLYQSYSEDGGEHWTLGKPTDLASGEVPCWLNRLKTTGDLLVIWNQVSHEEIKKGYSRGRLSVAISKDEGNTWVNHRTVECSGGLEDIDRIEPSRAQHVRAQPDLGVLPEPYTRHHYPQLALVQGKVVMKYSHDRAVDGKFVRQSKLKVVSEDWFY